jgi:hypothetical protein
VARDLSRVIGELRVPVGVPLRAHGHEELVHHHGGVDGHLAARQRLQLLLADGARALVRQQLHESVDAHAGEMK